MCMFSGKTLNDHIDYWKFIGTPERVLNWIRFGVPINAEGFENQVVHSPKNKSAKEIKFIRSEVEELLSAGILGECLEPPRVVSPIHAVAKKHDKFRLQIFSTIAYKNNFFLI